MLAYLRDHMERSASRLRPFYGLEAGDVAVDEDRATVTLKIFCPDPAAGDSFDLRGINRQTGCVVVVRPDQYVSHVLPLEAHDSLADFSAGTLVERGTRQAGRSKDAHDVAVR